MRNVPSAEKFKASTLSPQSTFSREILQKIESRYILVICSFSFLKLVGIIFLKKQRFVVHTHISIF